MLVTLSFCNKDADQAERLAQWIAELSAGKGHELLLGVDTDVDEVRALLTYELLTRCFDKVHELRIKNPYDTWPQAANHCFQEISRYIEHKQLAKYFCWMEPDAAPLSSNCFTALEAEYLEARKPFLGQFVKGFNGGPDHMSGIGIYPGQLTHHAGPMLLATTTPFDIAAAQMVMPKAHFTDLIFHRWKGLAFDTLDDLRNMIGPVPVLYHSDKRGQIIQLLQEEKNLEDTQNQGSGSNATSVRQVEREPRGVIDPALIRSDAEASVVGTENDAGLQTVTETGTAVATFNPATKALAPSAAPDIAQTDRTLKRFTTTPEHVLAVTGKEGVSDGEDEKEEGARAKAAPLLEKGGDASCSENPVSQSKAAPTVQSAGAAQRSVWHGGAPISAGEQEIVPWRDKAESLAEVKRLCLELKAFCKAPWLTRIVREELKEAGVIKKVR